MLIKKLLVNIIKPLHYQCFSRPRLSILSTALSDFIPTAQKITALDIGCGAGDLINHISILRPSIDFVGIDILERTPTDIKKRFHYQTYDGIHIPFPDQSFSFSMLVDVLHHAEDARSLLAEAMRVSRDFILIKDHNCNSTIDNQLLKLMDWVGNKSYDVALPYHYLSASEWDKLFQELKLSIEMRHDQVKLYHTAISLIFKPTLHFIIKLKIL